MKKHKIIIIPGLSDYTSFIRFITYRFNSPEFDVEVLSFGWSKSDILFENRIEELSEYINSLNDKFEKISLIGVSAGGSAVLNLFSKNNNIHRIVNVCGRLKPGIKVSPSLEKAAKNSISFKESVIQAEINLNNLSSEKKSKIMTISPYLDGTVPTSTMSVDSGYNLKIMSMGHMVSIFIGLVFYRRSIIKFLSN